MNSRFATFIALLAGLAFSILKVSSSLPALVLGFLLGLLIAETPLASQLQELFGLTSRDPGKVGLDILYPQTGEHQGKDAEIKSQLNHEAFYGLKHATLNLEVTGWWFNMGLWDKENKNMRFQDACKALVEKVTSHVGIDQQSHILDVGFGCGDQDVYMAQLHRPARITGITIEPIQHHVAQQLVKRTETPGTDIRLYVADASKLPEFLESTPDVFRDSTTAAVNHFTHVISIDSAFHYNTRAKFLKDAANALVPETGRLAMADMILARPRPTSPWGQWIFELVFRAVDVPPINMKSMEEYRRDLEEAGFVDIEIECVEDRVFSELGAYAEKQSARLRGMMSPGVTWRYWCLSKGARWVDRNKWLHFMVVKARKGPHRS